MRKLTLLLFALFAWSASQAQYSIYPVPQQQISGGATVGFTSTVETVYEAGIDTYTRKRFAAVLTAAGLKAKAVSEPTGENAVAYIGVNGSGGAADVKASERGLNRTVFTRTGKFDRHLLTLRAQDGKAELIVLGENTDAAFYALATLEQMLEHGTSSLPTVTFYDFSDKQYRGVVEGYYGYPYSISVKKDLFDYMMRFKMNTYLYGGKNDPYHKAQWKSAYPVSVTAEQEKNGTITQGMVQELTQRAHETKVNFIWAVHPGDEFLNSSTVVTDLMNKFTLMYNLGVRQFAIFVDDVGIPSTEAGFQTNANNLTAVQQAIEAKWNSSATAEPADTVKPLFFVPQIYCRTFASSTSQFNQFFQSLSSTPSNVAIFITGYAVWSVPNTSDCNMFKDQLGRGVGWWWNYPCNDNGRGKSDIYVKDMYSNFVDMPNVNSNSRLESSLENNFGVICNPMQQGTASKIALFSAADFAWNHAAFSYTKSWKAAVRSVVNAEDADEFEFLADYLRYNDPSDFATLLTQTKSQLSNASSAQVKSLAERFDHIAQACDRFIAYENSDDESQRLLYDNLAPWLQRLRSTAAAAHELIALAQTPAEGNEAAIWNAYVPYAALADSFSTAQKYRVDVLGSWYDALPSGKDLPDFYTWLQANALNNYFTRTPSATRQPITNLQGDDAKAVRAMQNSSTKAYYINLTRTLYLGKGEYVGIQLPGALRMSDALIADSLLERFTVECSENFKDVTAVTSADDLKSGFVRYVVFRNDSDEPRALRLSNRNFSVTPTSAPAISSVEVPSGGDASGTSKSALTDGDYTTWYSVNRNQQNEDSYTLTLSEPTVIHDVRVCIGTVNGDYMNGGAVQISANGTTWRSLKIKGTNTTVLTIGNSKVVTYSDAMKYCDFDGVEGFEAKYVRFRITSANTSKWLRLFEIEVNKHSLSSPLATDGAGNDLSYLADGAASRNTADAQAPIVYNLVGTQPVQTVYVYQDAAASSNVRLQATLDGSSWTTLATLRDNYEAVDLTGYEGAKAVRLMWSGTAPRVYEIEESPAEDETPTGIGAARTDEAGVSVGTAQGRIEVSAQVPLRRIEAYDLAGRRLASHHVHGRARSAALSLHARQGDAALVRITLADGRTVTRKLLGR